MSSHKSSEKKTKRMNMGGKASLMAKIRSKMNAPRGAMPVRGGGGVPVQGPMGVRIPSRPGMVKGPGGVRFEGRPGPVRGPAMPYGGMGGPVKTGMGTKKMASGGKVRGGGAATKGLKISKKMG